MKAPYGAARRAPRRAARTRPSGRPGCRGGCPHRRSVRSATGSAAATAGTPAGSTAPTVCWCPTPDRPSARPNESAGRSRSGPTPARAPGRSRQSSKPDCSTQRTGRLTGSPPPTRRPPRPGSGPRRCSATSSSWATRSASARLYVTAHGIYEAFLNGSRIGTAELTPGFTQYDARLQVQTYDVSDLLRPGRNALAVILADGWYRGQIGITRASDQWGTNLALLAQLQRDARRRQHRRVRHRARTGAAVTGTCWRPT